MMYVKKLRRKCGVRGCRKIETFAISRTREAGNSVIICRDCLEEALKAIDSLAPNERDNRKNNTSQKAPALFFNTAAHRITEKVEETKPVSDTTEVETLKENLYVCLECGRSFETEKGLKMHLKTCKGKNKE